MAEGLGTTRKRELMREIILSLHDGEDIRRAKERFVREVGSVTSVEIAEIEQALIAEGMPVEQIKQFCNVHALLFEEQLAQEAKDQSSPSHPVELFKAENRKIEEMCAKIEAALGSRRPGSVEFKETRASLLDLIEKLRPIDLHYVRKEQVLFPYLEKHDFTGPSTVMWGKHDDIRRMLKESIAAVKEAGSPDAIKEAGADHVTPLIEEIRGMITKEELILFPTAMERIEVPEWVEILKHGDEVGYAFISPPRETEFALNDLRALEAEGSVSDAEGTITMPSGTLSMDELVSIFSTLPIDLTFVDAQDGVRYFSEGADRIFTRPRSIIGRKVQACHPPRSLAAVEAILDDFKAGRKNSESFWLTMNGRFILIQYFAVRGKDGSYLGTLEASQDVTAIRALEGERRLL